MSFPHFDVFISLWGMAERKLLFKFLKFYDKKHFVPQHWEAILAAKSRFENMLSTYIFPLQAALPQVFDKVNDQKVIRKDMKESWNSVLHLLAYTHNVQLNEILDQRYKTPALTLDINPSWWWLFMFWHCTFGFALVYKHCVKQFKGTLGSIAWVLIHAKLGKSTKFVCTVILSPSNNYSLGTPNAAIKTVVSAY